MEAIYLDSAATTKPVDSIIEAIKPYIETDWYNPSALYSKGKKIKDKIEEVRSFVAKELHAKSQEIYFTSGATESNHWVIRGFIDECKVERKQPVMITTHIEHKSIEECIKNLCCIESDLRCEYLSINNYGEIKIRELEEVLKYLMKNDITNETKILVSIGMANSEIGTIQNIKEISKMVHRYKAILHTDATQAFGHISINVNVLGTDFLTASAQKLGGIKGTGFLYKREGVNIKPLIYGSQEKGQRGGTENVIGIVALGEAIKQIDYDFERIILSSARNYMIKELVDRFHCKINGSIDHRLPNNINVTFPQAITGEGLIYMLDMCSIYISSGSACNSYSNLPSHVLQEIGLSEDEISRTIRITLPRDITQKQMDRVMNEIEKQIQVLTM